MTACVIVKVIAHQVRVFGIDEHMRWPRSRCVRLLVDTEGILRLIKVGERIVLNGLSSTSLLTRRADKVVKVVIHLGS